MNRLVTSLVVLIAALYGGQCFKADASCPKYDSAIEAKFEECVDHPADTVEQVCAIYQGVTECIHYWLDKCAGVDIVEENREMLEDGVTMMNDLAVLAC